MRPKKKQYVIKMPLSFENRASFKILGKKHFLISALTLLVWLIASIVIVIKGTTIRRVTYPILMLIAISIILRYIVMREKYYKKKKEELDARDYVYDHNLFWNIYEISDSSPHIYRYVDGKKAIFVEFEKDVIIGKVEDNDFYHHEAIADAYLQAVKRNITCVHIDYMDTVGKDPRMEGLFENAGRVKNNDLKELLTVAYSNIQQNMYQTYDSHDVYCFYYAGTDSLFWEELLEVINYFLRANYLRARVLNAHEVGDLAKTIMNLNTFSVNSATSRLFTGTDTDYITPIWVKKGVEKEILNQTIEEKQEAQRILEVEKEAKKAKRKFGRSSRGKLLKKVREQQELDLFSDTTGPEYEEYGGEVEEIEENEDVVEQEEEIKEDENLWDL